MKFDHTILGNEKDFSCLLFPWMKIDLNKNIRPLYFNANLVKIHSISVLYLITLNEFQDLNFGSVATFSR